MLSASALLAFFCLAGPSFSAETGIRVVESFLKDAKAGDSASVAGVVLSVKADAKTFGLADARRAGCCASSSNCGVPTLPVKWAGKMPDEKARVLVKGKVIQEEGKLLFAADSVTPWVQGNP